MCLKKAVYTADSARGSHLTDESANSICHHDLEHKRHVFCELKLFPRAIKTDGIMKMNDLKQCLQETEIIWALASALFFLFGSKPGFLPLISIARNAQKMRG